MAADLVRQWDSSNSWMERLLDDVDAVGRSMSVADGTVNAVAELLRRIQHFSAAQPQADEWCKLYACILELVERVSPSIPRANGRFRVHFCSLVQFLSDNVDLAR